MTQKSARVESFRQYDEKKLRVDCNGEYEKREENVGDLAVLRY